jgi:hypothetical protein
MGAQVSLLRPGKAQYLAVIRLPLLNNRDVNLSGAIAAATEAKACPEQSRSGLFLMDASDAARAREQNPDSHLCPKSEPLHKPKIHDNLFPDTYPIRCAQLVFDERIDLLATVDSRISEYSPTSEYESVSRWVTIAAATVGTGFPYEYSCGGP